MEKYVLENTGSHNKVFNSVSVYIILNLENTILTSQEKTEQLGQIYLPPLHHKRRNLSHNGGANLLAGKRKVGHHVQ